MAPMPTTGELLDLFMGSPFGQERVGISSTDATSRVRHPEPRGSQRALLQRRSASAPHEAK